jgi:hypothetical protein
MSLEPAALGWKLTPAPLDAPNPKMLVFSIVSEPPVLNLMPLTPDPLKPLIVMLRIVTLSLAPALMFMPLVPDARIEPTCPPMPPPQSSVMALVTVTAPKPPGSRQSISPPPAVLVMAPAKVLHGAVRLQGLASSPTPEMQVRAAWAFAG